MSKNWIDVSVPLHTGMVHWPTDPSVHIERFADMNKGAICNVSKVEMCAHAGTHMDGLNHFIKDGVRLSYSMRDEVLTLAETLQGPLQYTVESTGIVGPHSKPGFGFFDLDHRVLD